VWRRRQREKESGGGGAASGGDGDARRKAPTTPNFVFSPIAFADSASSGGGGGGGGGGGLANNNYDAIDSSPSVPNRSNPPTVFASASASAKRTGKPADDARTSYLQPVTNGHYYSEPKEYRPLSTNVYMQPQPVAGRGIANSHYYSAPTEPPSQGDAYESPFSGASNSSPYYSSADPTAAPGEALTHYVLASPAAAPGVGIDNPSYGMHGRPSGAGAPNTYVLAAPAAAPGEYAYAQPAPANTAVYQNASARTLRGNDGDEDEDADAC